jgi:hypothetical protein
MSTPRYLAAIAELAAATTYQSMSCLSSIAA